MEISALLETAMLLCFGASWPISVYKSWKTRSTKGKSLLFLVLIDLGYVAGITRKIMLSAYEISFYFYILNFLMVLADVCLYFANRAREKRNPTDTGA